MLDWEKMGNLIPAILQDCNTREVLMLGYVNPEAWELTLKTKQVTFYSRSKQRLWTKGETSGNTLQLIDYRYDCDSDALLLIVQPEGPTCHLGNDSCFDDDIIQYLETTISDRRAYPSDGSYTTSLLKQGRKRIAQKVGEESIEFILAVMAENREEIINECADLLYHWLVLLNEVGLCWGDILNCLRERKR